MRRDFIISLLRGCLRVFTMLALGLFCVLPTAWAEEDTAVDLAAQLQQFKEGGFDDKARIVAALESSGDERAIAILKSLLAGVLYYRKADERVVIVKDTEDGYRLTDVLNGESLGDVERRDVKKIPINNALRGQLRGALARLSLSHKSPAVRLAAVKEIIKDIDAETVPLLREALTKETDDRVLEALHTGVAMIDVGTDDKAVRLAAIENLGDTLLPEARQHLQALVEADNEADADIRLAATQALAKIESRRQVYGFLETVFFGLSLGSVLLLAAIGLAITFGVMGVINMAHGELMMLGAYTTYVVQLLMPNHIEYSLLVAVPAAFLVAGLTGIAIERGVIRFLYGRPLETLLATFGISLLLQQAVRSIFSPLNRSVETPEWMSGSLEINSALALTYNRLYIIIFSLMVFAALLLILKKTSLGLQVRAVAQNRDMARAMGIRTQWVDALTFGLGSGIAGVAGVALSQLTNVGPNLGQAYIIDSFMVVVFGGVGNLWGTLVGALSLGVVNKFLEPWSGAVLAKILVLIFIILFIQKRPRGLFPQKGRSAEG